MKSKSKILISNVFFIMLFLVNSAAIASGGGEGGEGDAQGGTWSEVEYDKVQEGISTNSIILGVLLLVLIVAMVIVRTNSKKKSAPASTSSDISKPKKASSSGGGIPIGNIINKLLKKSGEPILGVDITNESITISLITQTKSGLELQELVTSKTPQNAIRDGEIIDTTSVAQVIQEMIETNEIKVTKAITTVSGQAVITRTVQFPSMSPEELKEVVLHEAERYIPFPIEEVNIDFQTVGEIEDEGISKIEVLLVAAQKQFIETYVETFIIAGLQLIAVDIASFAVARALSAPEKGASLGAGMPIVLVLLRGETTDINVFDNGVPRFSRSIPIGSTTFIETIASNLNISLEEAIDVFDKVVIPVAGQTMSEEPLVEMASNEIRTTLKELTTEIQRSLEYFQNQEETNVQHLIISGRGAKIRNLDKHLSMNLGIDIEVCNPINYIQFDEEKFPAEYLINNSSIFVTALGLARRAVESGC